MRTASAVRATAAVVKIVPVERSRHVGAQSASVRTASAVRATAAARVPASVLSELPVPRVQV